MKHLSRHLRSLLVALVALALSAGLAFGAQPPEAASWGLANAGSHAGKTVPVQNGHQETSGEEETGEEESGEEGGETLEVEETEGVEESVEAGENCSTDPTTLTEEQRASMKHGSIVCWAAHQTEWPEWFSNHGAFVKCWAHQGKADAASCTEDPAAEEPTVEEPTAEATVGSHGNAKGKGKGKKNKHQE